MGSYSDIFMCADIQICHYLLWFILYYIFCYTFGDQTSHLKVLTRNEFAGNDLGYKWDSPLGNL